MTTDYATRRKGVTSFNLTNPIFRGTLAEACEQIDARYQANEAPYVQMHGFVVEHPETGQRITLAPQYYSGGVWAGIGFEVTVSSLGLGGQKYLIVQMATGYPQQWQFRKE